MYAIGDNERSDPKPRWGWLYAVVVALGGLLTVIEVALPDGLARMALEVSVVVVMLTVMALWVRANRVALALANEDHSARTVTYNRAWRWTTVGVTPKPSWSARAKKKRGRTAAS
jgi:hypothetical protein